MTTVVHIKDCPPGWRDDPAFVFIGRPGVYGNPYKIGVDGERMDVVLLFRDYCLHRIEEDGVFRHLVRELYGKSLVCFCKPHPCHGTLLCALADQLHGEAVEFQRTLDRLRGVDWKAVREAEREERRRREAAVHTLAVTAQAQADKIKSFDHFKRWRKKFADPLLKGDLCPRP
jgi:hypothetical protein